MSTPTDPDGRPVAPATPSGDSAGPAADHAAAAGGAGTGGSGGSGGGKGGGGTGGGGTGGGTGGGGTGGGGKGGGAGEAPKLSPYLKILRRAVRSISSVFEAHVMVFQTEAEKEVVRVAIGVGLIFSAAAFLLATALLTGAGAVALIQRLTALPWLESIGLAMLATALMASLLGFIAWLRLRKPLMPRTRKLFKSTFDGLTKG